MSARYSYTTCISFGTDGEADYCELDATVSFSVAWGSPERGRFSGPPEDYDPGSADVVEDLRLEAVDGNPFTGSPTFRAMILDEMERVAEGDMLATARDDAAAAAADAEDRRAEQRREQPA